MHMDPEDGSSWHYTRACFRSSSADSAPTESGGAEQVLPDAPPGQSEGYVILWPYPLAFAADTEPKGELSGTNNPGTVPAYAPNPGTVPTEKPASPDPDTVPADALVAVSPDAGEEDGALQRGSGS